MSASVEELRVDVAVIGAGPGGATLAALLAQRGIRVLLLDRDTFPRDKVCGEFLSWDALPVLDSIGVLERIDEAGAARIDCCSIETPGGSREFELPFEARGISRTILDAAILESARARGAMVMEGWTATRVEPRADGGFILARNRDGREMKISAAVLAGAWGRWGRLDIQMQRSFVRENRRRHFGFKRHYASRPEDDRVIRLYSFERGYLGVSAVEGNATNICGLVHDSRLKTIRGRWPEFVDDLQNEGPRLDALFSGREPRQEGFLSSEPVIFTAREPVLDGMLLVGDAAGMIDPLAGNGMAMAIQSALLAAGTIVQRLSGGRLAEVADRLYSRTFTHWFHDRIRWSRRGALVLSRPALLSALVRLPAASSVGRYLARKTRADMGNVERLVKAWESRASVPDAMFDVR